MAGQSPASNRGGEAATSDSDLNQPSVADAVEVGGAADEEGTVGDGHGGEGGAVELIGRQVFELAAWSDDDRFAFLTQKVDLSVCVNRRGGVIAAKTSAPEFLSCLGIDTR